MAPTLNPHPGQFQPKGVRRSGKKAGRGAGRTRASGETSPSRDRESIKKIQLTAPGIYPDLDSGKRDRFRVSSGTRDPKRFEALRLLLAELRDERRYDVLRALMERRIRLDDLAAAAKVGKAAVTELVAGVGGSRSRLLRPIVDEYVEELRTQGIRDWRKSAQILRRFIDDHGGDRVATVGLLEKKTVQTWLMGLRTAAPNKPSTPAANATRNRYRAWISGLATFCLDPDRQYIEHHPIAYKRVKRADETESNRRMPDATPAEYRAYFKAAAAYREDLALALRVLWHTGADVGELLGRDLASMKQFTGVLVRDVVFGPTVSKIRLRRTKVGTKEAERWVPLPPAVARALRQHIRRYRLGPTDPLFGMIARTWNDARGQWSYPELRAAHNAACRAARKPLATFRVKDLRHMAAITWARAGLPIEEISKLLGHSTIQQTQKYAAYVKSEKEQAAVAAAGGYYLTPAKGRRRTTRARKPRAH
ncbi:MAG: tyrosine-type recombinase/integrase [Gemmatimonadaceae bacterium]